MNDFTQEVQENRRTSEPRKQREQKPSSLGLCRVAFEEDEINAEPSWVN